MTLVLAGATPGPVVRRQERLRHSIGRAVPADHEATGHTGEAAVAARLLRIADVRSGTAEQEDGAIHESTSSAREKPTKVNLDDEGRSGVRSANGLTPGVGKESGSSACGKLLEEGKQTNRQTWRDLTALVGGRDECSHERTQLRTSDEAQSKVKGSSDHLVGRKVKIQTGVNTVGRIGNTPLTATLKGS